jgi:hypothetical protein
VRLKTFPLPLKVLATCFLLTIGIGYLLSLAYVYFALKPYTKQGEGIAQALIGKYYGKRQGTRLEVALAGSMGEVLTEEEKEKIMSWVRQGAHEDQFVSIQRIIKRACYNCHDPQSPARRATTPPMISYSDISKYTTVDLGDSIQSLVGISHIHLFGISFIFLLTSAIFAFSETSPVFRSLLIFIPFAAVWLDIGSWWLTKYHPLFAYIGIIGGAFMGLALAGQICISLYEMWGIKRYKDIPGK